MKRCIEIRTCPASHYLICKAYKEGKSCWEVPIIPCCKRSNKDRCHNCSVYIDASKE